MKVIHRFIHRVWVSVGISDPKMSKKNISKNITNKVAYVTPFL